MVATRMTGLPKPNTCGSHSIWLCAISAEQIASSDPTERSIWRATITKTMPVAMMPTETVCTEMLKILRGDRNLPSVMNWNTTQRTAKARIIPNRRLSSSSVSANPRRAGAPVVVGPASLILSPPMLRQMPRSKAPEHPVTGQPDLFADVDVRAALAQQVFGDPAGIQNKVQVCLSDRLRLQQDRGQLFAAGRGERGRAGDISHRGAAGQSHGDFACGLAKRTAVFPHRNGLGAKRHTVQGGHVAILTRNRNTGHALRGQRRHNATSGAVVRGHKSVNTVVSFGQDLLHVLLGVGGLPVVGVGFGNDGDVACVNRGLQNLLLATAQEVCVRVNRRAFDHDIAA